MELWYPEAVHCKALMRSRGEYKNKWPKGAVIHFTAGRDNPQGAIDLGIKNGYAYVAMGSDGKIYQAMPFNQWGYHAGESEWPGLGHGVSQYLLGIEICCAGGLKKEEDHFISWFGKKYSKEEVRYSPNKDNIKYGHYHKYTDAQEKSLLKFLLWLKTQNPDVFDFDFVIGHDECCIPKNRKNDPGASLSLTMPEFRKYLNSEYEKQCNDL